MTDLRDVKEHKDLANVPDLNAQVIADFRANGGRVGGPYEGARIILVHHVGEKTGTQYVSPMTYFPQDDGSIVVVASNRGAPKNPSWYRNLMANPRTEVEVGVERFPVMAEEITGKARDAVWAQVVAQIPAVIEYQKKTSRMIPLLRFVRLD
ncbi:nitroreductase/quinone reductase family protein [Actinomadura madurae]|uniref:Deazaflavin-dependent oxidoreductase, nitroreductase family n=1 Tax=Actinomadura madurae TaxID=1993 RepID=A0A1I5GMD1_9ACTN|nr:nitroreductase/quinone reductase family protein [Actinomadura madurae]SFO37103.1 deazaflavin-dependent oxidoreductase, nitroreductase family [Actinomadura madurae]SPT51401.1 Deazaflavin-dependent nitroreductase [Actinomadura madurae]